MTEDVIRKFGHNMFGGDFVFSVSREFVRRCRTPLLLQPGTDKPHPAETSAEIARLAPNLEIQKDWRGPDAPGRVDPPGHRVPDAPHAEVMNDALTGQTVELLQQLIRNQCVNDGTVASGQEVRTSDVLRTYLAGQRPRRRGLRARRRARPHQPRRAHRGHRSRPRRPCA